MPVVVHVDEPGGRRAVRVGQALVTGSEVVLSLDALSLQLELPEHATPIAAPEARTPASTVHVERRLSELEWLAQRSRRILADPKKVRWHEDSRQQLRQIEVEMDQLRSRVSAAPH